MNDKNDKEEKIGFDEFTQRKSVRYSVYVYAVMVLLVVAVTVASIISLSQSDIGITDFSIPQISIPEISVPEISTPFEESQLPVIDDVSGVIADESIPTTPAVALPVEYVKVITGHSPDALVFSQTMQDYRTHTGVDLQAPLGTEVSACCDGTISYVGEDPFLGVCVIVTHDYGMTTHYCNLQAELPQTTAVGAAVKAGDVIGFVGQTAICELSDEAHLHFEVRVNGAAVDPQDELLDRV